jgi:AcrR family transcriptional regulator
MRTVKDPEERRAEIVETARELFQQKGIAGTRINDITEKVGVALGLFYYYFKSKEDIVQTVFEELLEHLDAVADAIVRDEGLDFYQKIVRIMDLYMDNARHLQRLEDSEQRQFYQKAEDHLLRYCLDVLRQGVEQRIVRIAYFEEMAMVLFYGIKEFSREKPLEREVLLTLVEQGFNLACGSLCD